MLIDFSFKNFRSFKKEVTLSMMAAKSLRDDIITEDDLHMLSPGDGYKWSQVNEVIGKTVTVEIPANEVIYPDMIK